MKRKLLFLSIVILALGMRIYQFGQNPPSLYWDEASLGYNAFSIAMSLHDEHGEFLPLDRFIAFGDYKPPGYIYADAVLVKLFGLNEFSVRAPSLIAGVLMVMITFSLVKLLFGSTKLALLASFFLAISPWSIQFSRAAFEAHLAAFFNLAGVYFFLKTVENKKMIILSIIFFVFSFYTFNANRIIAPLLLAGLSIIYFKVILKNIWTYIAIATAIVLLYPSFSYLNSRESKLRLQEVSIFNNLQPVELSNSRVSTDGNAWWAKLMHNRRVLFSVDYLKHYTDNFSGSFLFTHGDVNPRLSVQNMGQLYAWELPFLFFGIYFLVKQRKKAAIIIFLWMVIIPIPAGVARETPHALRILSILPTYQIITALGVYQFSQFFRGKLWPFKYNILLSVICCFLSVNIYYYAHQYFIHYPQNWSGEWQYGYKQMVQYVEKARDNYDQIFVSSAMGRPYIYFAFYGQYPPEQFLALREAQRDWFGFWEVTKLGKISFDFKKLAQARGRVLLVTTSLETPTGFRQKVKIVDGSGKSIFYISEKI